MARGPVQVQAACESALGALVDAFAQGAVAGSREEWAAALGALQQVVNVACAAQDAAMARLAAIEPELLEDGTVVESHRGLGHVAVDAPAIVSGVLAGTAVHAERRVRTAVRLAGDGPARSATETGLGGLHAAMRQGRLDAYRASVVADELEHAPAPVRASVVAALEGHFAGEAGPSCGGGAVGCWPGSAPTCCTSAPPGPAPSPGCGGGPTNPAWTTGKAPSLRGSRPGVGGDRRPGPAVRQGTRRCATIHLVPGPGP